MLSFAGIRQGYYLQLLTITWWIVRLNVPALQCVDLTQQASAHSIKVVIRYSEELEGKAGQDKC